MADRCFTISDSVGLKQAKLTILAFTKRKSQLDPVDVERTCDRPAAQEICHSVKHPSFRLLDVQSEWTTTNSSTYHWPYY